MGSPSGHNNPLHSLTIIETWPSDGRPAMLQPRIGAGPRLLRRHARPFTDMSDTRQLPARNPRRQESAGSRSWRPGMFAGFQRLFRRWWQTGRLLGLGLLVALLVLRIADPPPVEVLRLRTFD